MIHRAIMKCATALAAGTWISAVATTSVSAATSTAAYGVIKQENYEQTSTAMPDPTATQGFSFTAFAIATATNSLTSVYYAIGAETAVPLTRETNSGDFYYSQSFDLKDDLDLAFPGGNTSYKMTITGTDGTHQPTLKFLSELYPIVPRITNYPAVQSINATAAFTFYWDPIPGGTTNDAVRLVIADANTNTVYSSGNYGTTNGLDGTTSSLTIGANTLQAGNAYRGALLFGKINALNPANQFIYSGVKDIVGYARLTTFSINTAAGGPPYSLLEVLTNNYAGTTLRFTTSAGYAYRVESSTNLSAWSTILSTNPVSTNVIYTDAASTGQTKKFYRISSP